MFHNTPPILALVFISLLCPSLSSARSIQTSSRFKQHEDVEDSNKVVEQDSHIRHKRGIFSGISTGLTVASWGSYGVSMGVTVYLAIRKCEDFRPSSCVNPTCKYLSPCPNFLCQSPENNKNFVNNGKVEMKKELDNIDASLLDAFKYELDGKTANFNNERILTKLDQINQNVDRFASGIVALDGNFNEKFKNKSLEIQAMVLDKRTTLDGIVTSPIMQGIFDKWTWDGTGRFVFSVALTIGYALYGPLKQRYAINKIYNEMAADFTQKFQNQRTAANPNGFGQPRLHNKFAYVQGLTTKQIQSQIKSSATAVYKSNQAQQSQGFVVKIVGPVVNGLYTALSVWSTYKAISDCQKITNDMYDTAVNITYTRDEIEKIKVTEVQPLFGAIYNQTWKPVKDLLNNGSLLDIMEGIKNLTEEANFTDISPAETLKDFLAKIATSTSPTSLLSLQQKLIPALDTIAFRFNCLANKQHALATVINDCKIGRNTLQVLHTEAETTYDLNTEQCVKEKIVPYTTPEQLQNIIIATAKEKGWYDNCLLNDHSLLYRVCSTKGQGYVKPADIVTQLNNSALTQDMVSNFLTRCPPPSITPKRRLDTCSYYCLYRTTQQIATSVGLLESQVKGIIPSCAICEVSDTDATKIRYSYFCKAVNATNIAIAMKIPLPTVNDVISKCVQKCVLNEAEKQDVCQRTKCKQYDSTATAIALNLPVASIDEVKPQCDTIITKCMISDEDKNRILVLHCVFKASDSAIAAFVRLPLQDIQEFVNSQTCNNYP